MSNKVYKIAFNDFYGTAYVIGRTKKIFKTLIRKYSDTPYVSLDVHTAKPAPYVCFFDSDSVEPEEAVLETETFTCHKSKKELLKDLKDRIGSIKKIPIKAYSISDAFRQMGIFIGEERSDLDNIFIFNVGPRTWMTMPESSAIDVSISSKSKYFAAALAGIDFSKCFVFKIEKDKNERISMGLRQLLDGVKKERALEPVLMKELRKAHKDLGHPILSPEREHNSLSTGFYVAKDWGSFVEYYTGHRSSHTMKLFLSKIVKQYDCNEHAYGIDDLLEQYEAIKNEDKDFEKKHLEFNVKVTLLKQRSDVNYILLLKTLLAKKIGLNIGQIQSIIENDEEKNVYEKQVSKFSNHEIDGMTNLLRFIGNEKSYEILKKIKYSNLFELVDSVRMFESLKNASSGNVQYDLERVKKIPASSSKSLHDGLVAENVYLESKIDSIDIEYPEYVKKLEKIKIEGMRAVLPKTSGDLIEIGYKLHNCIGTYKKKVASGQANIVVFVDEKSGDYKMAMNVDVYYDENLGKFNSKIVEFREDYNVAVQDETKKLVEDQLVKIYSKNYKDSFLAKESK